MDRSLRQLAQLPTGLRPTLFLRQPGEAALRRLLSISGDGEIFYRNGLLQICSPTVVFTTRPISTPAVRRRLPSCGTPFRRVSQSQIEELRQLQGQLLKYRLTRHQQVAESTFDAPNFCPETRLIARMLGACLEGDTKARQQMIDALGETDETTLASAAQSPEAIVLEALLVLVHERRDQAFMREIRELAQGIFLGRQDPTRLRDQDVGTIVRDTFGLVTRRQKKGISVDLEAIQSAAIHREAYARGVLHTA